MESKTKLLDQMRHVLRLKHLSIRTEKAYVQWAKRFILFHHKRHPADMGGPRNPADRKNKQHFCASNSGTHHPESAPSARMIGVRVGDPTWLSQGLQLPPALRLAPPTDVGVYCPGRVRRTLPSGIPALTCSPSQISQY